MQGYKKRKLTELTIEEKMDAYEDIKIKMDYHQNVANKFNISLQSVTQLVRGIKENPSYFRKQLDKQNDR